MFPKQETKSGLKQIQTNSSLPIMISDQGNQQRKRFGDQMVLQWFFPLASTGGVFKKPYGVAGYARNLSMIWWKPTVCALTIGGAFVKKPEFLGITRAGTKIWYIGQKSTDIPHRHRLDGPAFISRYLIGVRLLSWWINGVETRWKFLKFFRWNRCVRKYGWNLMKLFHMNKILAMTCSRATYMPHRVLGIIA